MSFNRLDSLTNKIVFCIPIALETREEIAKSLINKYGMDYIFLGLVFSDRTTGESCKIDIYPRIDFKTEEDFNLIASFKSLGEDCLSAKTLKQLNNYRQIIYLISEDVGYDSCLKMAKYAKIFLDIGGIAIKVDSTGVVCDRDKWLANYNSEDAFDIYSLFVTLVQGDDCYYSCGMKNFGKADVSIDITEDVGLAIYVMNTFNYYRLTEPVILKDGQTFQPDLECPIYQMHWSKYNRYETEALLHNPNGKWHLSSVINHLNINYKIN